LIVKAKHTIVIRMQQEEEIQENLGKKSTITPAYKRHEEP